MVKIALLSLIRRLIMYLVAIRLIKMMYMECSELYFQMSVHAKENKYIFLVVCS